MDKKIALVMLAALTLVGCATKGDPAPINTAGAWSTGTLKEGDPELIGIVLNEDVLPEQLYAGHLLKEGVLVFPPGATELPGYLQEQVRQFARTHLAPQEWIEQGWEYQLVVVGHTDATGTPEANKLVRLKRAEHVRKLLLEGGAPPKRVVAVAGPPGHGRYIEFFYEVLDD